MARDLPDWGALSAQATVHEVTDLGELAVRLGSIVSFDRRGDVLWFDGFENGIAKWVATVSGSSGGIVESEDTSRNGAASVKLTAGSTVDHHAYITHHQSYPSLSRFGFEYSFALQSTNEALYWVVYLYDGTNYSSFQIRWIPATKVLQYLNASNTFVTFATGVDLNLGYWLFHTGKLVIDGPNNEYVRFILNETEYDLSGYGMYSYPSATLPELTNMIWLVGREGENDIVYGDDVILTQNEPPNA